MKLNKLTLACFTLLSIVTMAYAVVTAYTFPPGLNDEQKTMWTAILDLMVQKTGDTLTGDLGVTGGNVLINTAGKGLVIETGSAGASSGRLGRFAFSSGVTSLYSNSTVTANSHVFITPFGTSANIAGMSSTNAAGLGVQLIALTPCTNSFNILIVEGQ